MRRILKATVLGLIIISLVYTIVEYWWDGNEPEYSLSTRIALSDSLLQKGNRLIVEDNLHDAVKVFKQVLIIQPKNQDALEKLVKILEKKAARLFSSSKYPETLEICWDILKHDPKSTFSKTIISKIEKINTTADFIVVENPGNLIVYNLYEQQISFREQRSLFPYPYQPIRIIETDGFFSDMFTRCMKIRLGYEFFFLRKDGKGNLSNFENLGYHKIFHKCSVLSDTVEVLKDRTLFLRKRPELSSSTKDQKNLLLRGNKLIQIFDQPQESPFWVYVKVLNDKLNFGWVYLPKVQKGISWRIY